jgi:Spy/CpxP family protein refolding chaperone
MPSPNALEGPPPPATMHDSIGVTGEHLTRYARLYANHTAATQPLRDSLRTTMKNMRSAFQSGDRSEARTRHQAAEQEWKELSTRDKAFDKALKDVLTKDQQKRYAKWKDDREKAAREQWHGQGRPAGAAGVEAPDRAPGRGNL